MNLFDGQIPLFDKPKKVFDVTIRTRVNFESGEIMQELLQASEALSREVYKTREAQLRRALIQLGWTPPPDEKPES